MMIAFKPRVQDATIASYRYRVQQPLDALRARGHEVEIFDEAHSRHYDAVVFSKSYGEEDQRVAEQLSSRKCRIYLDLCDNHFYNPQGLKAYQVAKRNLHKMISLSDRVICSTDTLSRAVAAEANLAYVPAIAPDPWVENSVAVRPRRAEGDTINLLWFGRHGSPNAPSGMSDLLLIRHFLANAARKRRIELTICSDNREKFVSLFADFPVACRYVEWTSDSFEAALAETDAVLIPLSQNPFVAAKTHNRLTLALGAGVPVVADSIDSYREFGRFCYLDNWTDGLDAVVARPEEARTRARDARLYLKQRWSMSAVVPDWESALGLSDPRSQAKASLAPVTLEKAESGTSWINSNGRVTRPWLICGEGADAALVGKARDEGFVILSVGRGFAKFPVDASLIVDIETLRDHPEQALSQCGQVFLPAYPHLNGWATPRPAEAWEGILPMLGTLRSKGRLCYFELRSGSSQGALGDLGGEETALELLAAAGVKNARHLGVRTTAGRLSGFDATAPATRRFSGGIAALRRRHAISYGPYGYPVPARIFVGSDNEQLIGSRVLEYSIQKHSTMDVEVEVLDFSNAPIPKEPKNRSKTGFSFCRFDIPRLCQYSGRGVYVDADMQVFTDITLLWTLPLDDADVLYAQNHPCDGRVPQTSVMLLNCAALDWNVREVVGGLDEGRYSYTELMRDICIHPHERVRPLIPYWWNSLERYEAGRTALLHYTDMPTQPWVSRSNRNGGLWYAELVEALDTGFIREEEVVAAIDQGHVSPELPDWIGRGGIKCDRRANAVWVAPYHRFTRSSGQIEGRASLVENEIVGWAFDSAAPDERIRLRVLDGEEPLFEFVADEPVDILARHGKGDGHHGFSVEVPSEVWRSNLTSLRICVAGSDAELEGSPLPLLR
jgi:hypothetical protein